MSISSTAGGNYEALTTTSTATVNVTDDADATVVTLTAKRGLGDGRRQRGLYRQRGINAVTGSDLVVTLSNGATITIRWAARAPTAMPVTVTRGDDAYDRGTTAETVSISSTAGGNY